MGEYIYHYTSIETLALILKNKKIRFNSLKNVDDINETHFSDEDDINLSPNTLISCWTNNDFENLAFWNMYTPNMQGVRVKLPKEIFNIYSFTTYNDIYVKSGQFIPISLVPQEECFNENYWILPFNEYFFEVEYTDDASLLRPQIFKKDILDYTFESSKIGRYKSRIWEFQKEVRFKLFILPTKDRHGNKLNPLNDFMKILKEKIPAPLEIYYIPIIDDSFQRMEITLGPKCGVSQEIIVKALIDKYNPSAKLFKNKFEGLIR